MNFEEISKKVKKFSKDTVTEVQKMAEVRQLNMKVSEEKKHLKHLYREMGQKLFDKYKDAEQLPEGFEENFRKIEECFSAMDLFQDQIRAVKGVVLCPCCNMEVSATERYCTNCGNKMPEVVKIEDKIDEDAVVVESEVVEPEQIKAAQESEAEEESEAETVETENSEAAEVEESESEAVEAENSEQEVADAEESEPETVEAENGEPETADAEESEPEAVKAENSETVAVEAEKSEPETAEIESDK